MLKRRVIDINIKFNINIIKRKENSLDIIFFILFSYIISLSNSILLKDIYEIQYKFEIKINISNSLIPFGAYKY